MINGQKIYCTNGSWADICITFAKVEDKYTAFILDKTCEGWKLGGEEDKLGIKGSSTATFFFEDLYFNNDDFRDFVISVKSGAKKKFTEMAQD